MTASVVAERVLKPRREFEDILGGHGTALKIPERQYTTLADDIHLNPDFKFSLQEAKEIEARAFHRRHFWDSVRMTAGAQGVPLHAMAVARGLHVRPEKEPVSGIHDDLYELEQAARVREAEARDAQILKNIEASRKQVEEALNAPPTLTESIAEAARTGAGAIGGVAGGLVAGTPGHFLGKTFAGNIAADAVHVVDTAGQVAAGAARGAGKVASKAAVVAAKAIGFDVVDDNGREL